MEGDPINDTMTLNDTISSNCSIYSKEAIEMYSNASWLFESVLQTIIGIGGIIANTIAIPILCSKEMSSIFNRLLVLLAVYDNFYIICSLFRVMKTNINNGDAAQHIDFHEYAFAYGFYQLHSFVLCGSIFMTVALSLERYRAVWRPVEYHNQCIGVNPWKRALVSYLFPVMVFSTLFNIPKFFEIEVFAKVEYYILMETKYNLTTNETYEVSFKYKVKYYISNYLESRYIIYC